MLELIAWMESTFGAHIDWKQMILVGLSPIFALSFILEWQYMRKRKSPEYMKRQFAWMDTFTNLSLGGAYQVFELIVHVVFVGAAIFWFWDMRFFTIPINAWTILPIFIAVEFCYYWFHRTSHRVRWFWTAHVVHHTGEQMNMSTAMRQSMLYPITGWWLFFMPLVLLGVHPGVVFILYAVDLGYQFFIHTESVGKLHPWLEYIFDTPSNHRAHHGRNPQYIDKNYGGVIIVFDRWFGTYEEEQEPVEYGVATRQIQSHNPLKLNFQEFIDMWKDVLKPGPISQRLKHLWAPPEYVRPTDEVNTDSSANTSHPSN